MLHYARLERINVSAILCRLHHVAAILIHALRKMRYLGVAAADKGLHGIIALGYLLPKDVVAPILVRAASQAPNRREVLHPVVIREMPRPLDHPLLEQRSPRIIATIDQERGIIRFDILRKPRKGDTHICKRIQRVLDRPIKTQAEIVVVQLYGILRVGVRIVVVRLRYLQALNAALTRAIRRAVHDLRKHVAQIFKFHSSVLTVRITIVRLPDIVKRMSVRGINRVIRILIRSGIAILVGSADHMSPGYLSRNLQRLIILSCWLLVHGRLGFAHAVSHRIDMLSHAQIANAVPLVSLYSPVARVVIHVMEYGSDHVVLLQSLNDDTSRRDY